MKHAFLLFSISDRSTTKPKTFDPCWNEYFIHEVHNAKNINLTVFHDAAIPPDDFVANCVIPFEDLVHREKEQQDFWVSHVSLFHFNTFMYIYMAYFIRIIQMMKNKSKSSLFMHIK